MAAPKNIDHINFSKPFYYDETSPTGLRWNINVMSGKTMNVFAARAGDVAGNIHNINRNKNNLKFGKNSASRKVWRVGFLKKTFIVSRIVLILHGHKVDGFMVDHKNGDPLDNNISNLRVVSQRINCQNKKLLSCVYGFPGITDYVKEKRNKFYRYFAAYWIDVDRKPQKKFFSIKKFGIMEAFKRAVICRTDAIKKLNSEGMDYTERHTSTFDKPTISNKIETTTLYKETPINAMPTL